MSYIGEKGAYSLDPDNKLDFDRAKQMAKEGFDPVAIKIRTGWEKGVDHRWRYEMSDPFIDSVAIEDYVKPRFGESINIRMLLKDTRILDAYPILVDIAVYAMYSPRKGTAGYYNRVTNNIIVSMGKPSDIFDYQIEGVLLHEIQHLIQEIEDFAKGGDEKSLGRRRYHRLAGEVEARNICHRHFMTEDERRQKLRTSTQDVPDRDQILMFR